MRKDNEKDRSFEVPKNYFEDLENKVSSRLSNENQRGFKVPSGYFENFEVGSDKVSVEPKVVQLDKNRRSRILWMAAAASIMLFFGVKYMNTGQNQMEWKNLDQDEISFWIESDLNDLNAYDIAEAYQEVELYVPVPENSELYDYLNEIDLDQVLIEN